MVPDLEMGGMIGLMSSLGLGLMTEIKRPLAACCLMFITKGSLLLTAYSIIKSRQLKNDNRVKVQNSMQTAYFVHLSKCFEQALFDFAFVAFHITTSTFDIWSSLFTRISLYSVV